MAKALTDAERDELTSEREFLLKSLDDLERERAEGGIDAATYESLHSDYTARTAEVLRTLSAGRDERTKRAPIATRTRLLLAGAAVVFAATGAYTLTKASGERGAGQTITGNNAASSNDTVSLSGSIPDTYQGHLDAALRFEDEGNANKAASEYLAAAKEDPTKAEPLARLGWLLTQADDAQLATTAEGYLDAAIKRDPTYVDSYLYKGVLLYAVENKGAAAIPQLQHYLTAAPKTTATAARRTMAQDIIAKIQHPTASTSTP
jgi:cytochrome c-type biogenesis protein CcmH/NrfG